MSLDIPKELAVRIYLKADMVYCYLQLVDGFLDGFEFADWDFFMITLDGPVRLDVSRLICRA